MSIIDESFYSRDATVVAPQLLGLSLVAGDAVVRITEVEAYTNDDPASHSFRKVTARTATMFGPPGRFYVYLIYGMHHCLNIVTGADGDGQAVLVRAGVIDGIDRRLTNGPGKLAKVLGADRSWNGRPVHVLVPDEMPPMDVTVTPRIGISRAVEWPRRWVVRDR